MGLLILNGIPYSSTEQPGEIYSTEEREVGVWIDGRPLYQKTVTGRITQLGETYIQTGLSDLDYKEVVNATLIDDTYKRAWRDGYVKQLDGAMGGFIADANDDYAVSVYVNMGLMIPGTVYITIRYTKTTDTPGSGSYPLIDGGSSRFFHFSGEVWNSNAGTVKGRGSVDVTLTGGIARIDFDIKFTSSGTNSGEFLHGINHYLLESLEPNLPSITPIEGGWWNYNYSGPTTDYGSTFEVDYEWWKPARYYDASNVNAHGAWAENQFSSGGRIYGVCFGTYS